MAKVKNGIRSYTTTGGDTRYSVVMKVQGKTVSKGGFTTKGAAERWRDVKRADVVKGDWIDPANGRIKFGAFAADWVATVDIKPSTRAVYEHLLNHQLSYWEDTPLGNITPTEVRRWEAKMRATPGVRTKRLPSDAWVAKSMRLFRRICQVAVQDGMLQRSPCEHLKIKSDRRADTYCPTPAEVLHLADHVPAEYRALVLVAGLGGLRWGEAIGLTRQNVDIAGRCVHVRQIIVETVDHQVYVQNEAKTAKGRRTVRVPSVAVEALAVHLARHAEAGTDGLLFYGTSSRDGAHSYLRRSNFYKRVWKPALKDAGLPHFRFHDLRHAGATLYAQTGATLAELMTHVGHSTPSAAMRYQHAGQERMETLGGRLDELVPSPAATATDNVVPQRPR